MMRFLPGAGRPFTGAHMLAIMLLFFGTIISVNIVMATAAVSTFPGLNAKNSYVASQNYNFLLQDAAEQEARGWTSGVAQQDGHLAFTLRNAENQAIGNLTVTALLARPVSTAYDTLVTLEREGDTYLSPEPLERGRWLIEIEARKDEELVWRQTRPFVAN